MDTIYTGNSTTLTGTSDADTIDNRSDRMTIVGNAGDDSISNFGSTSVSIFGDQNKSDKGGDTDDGNDTISNSGNSVRIYGRGGNDSIVNKGDNVYASGDNGNDFMLSNGNANCTISGQAGDDTIYNGYDYNSSNNPVEADGGIKAIIYGGAGKDLIYNHGSTATVAGEGDNDTITNNGATVSITGGDGNDNITNSGSTVTIQGGNGADNITNNGATVTIQGENGTDNITNSGSTVTIQGGADNDTISNSGSKVTIDGGAGNDSIYNDAASDVTINTSSGNDTIKLGAAVKSFKAEGFGAGDVIELATAATNLEKISGGIKAGNVSIIGVNNIVTVSNSWSTSTNSIVYNQTAAEAGAQLDGNTIIYANAGTSSLFTISGITSTVGVSLSGNEVILSKEALDGITGTVSIKGDYKLKLASDVDTIAEDFSAWTTLPNGNVAYFENGKDSYYSLSSDSKSVSYKTSVTGSNKVVLSGVKGTPTLSGATVNLNADNFNSNVAVVNNTGNYQFSLSGDFDGKKFTGTSSADTIANSGSNVTVIGGAGADSIYNSGSDVTIDGGKGDDYIDNSGSITTIQGNDGADTISNSDANVTIYGGAGNDQISLGSGAESNLISIEGNDTIYGYNEKSTVSVSIDTYLTLKAASNFLVSLGSTLVSLPGAYLSVDSVNVNAKTYPLINRISLTANADDVEITRNAISVKAFAGDDSILLSSSNVTLDAGDGNDLITVSGNGSSIGGGEKNDLISIGASAANNTIQYNDGDGNDTIYGFNSTTVLQIGDGVNDTYKQARSNDDLILTVGDGVISLVGAATLSKPHIIGKGEYLSLVSGTEGDDALSNSYSEVTILALGGNDTITNTSRDVFIDDGADNDLNYNFASNVTISGGEGSDTISNYENASSVSINGDAGDDFINNWSNSVEISGGDGKDSINNIGDFVSISGGAGDDSIYNWGNNVTISTGAGNDFIYGNGFGMVYVYTSGNDTIRAFNKTSTIVTGSYECETLSTDDGCLINLLDGAETVGSIFLQGYSGETNVTSISAGIETIRAFSAKKDSDIVTGTDGQDLISSSFASVSINAGSENDTIISSGNSATIYGGSGNDSIGSSGSTVTIDAGAGNDKISVSGSSVSIMSGAGDDSIKATVSSSTLRAGAGDDTVDLTSSTGNNLLVYSAGDGSDSIYNFSATDTISVASGEYNSVFSGNSLILTVGDDSITVYDAALLSTINIAGTVASSRNVELIDNNTSSPVTVDSDVDDIISFGRTKAVQITGNAKANSIVGGKGADTLDGVAGNDTLTGGNGSDIFIHSAGNDIITDYATGDKISLASTISDVDIDDNDVVLTTTNGSLKIVDGYKVRRYSGKLSNTDKRIAFITGKSSTSYTFGSHKIFDRTKTAITLTAGATDSTLTDLSSGILSKLKTIDASNSSLKTITGNGKANKIYASSIGATLNGAKGNDTLYGGDGADIFVYAKNSGKDVIVDYAASDTISLGAGATISDISTKKTDVIFKVGSKKNVVKAATDTTITFSENGTIKTFMDGVLYNADKTSATVSSNLSTATTISSAIIDASDAKKAVNITGDSSANSIVGGKRNDTLYGLGGSDTLDGGAGKDKIYGGAGNDTLIGGKGNDSLWGNDGADEFIFSKGDGKDVIFGFDDNDTLTLDKVTIKNSTVNTSGDVVTLKLSSGSITFKEFTATNFHIGKDTYSISNGSFVKK